MYISGRIKSGNGRESGMRICRRVEATVFLILLLLTLRWLAVEWVYNVWLGLALGGGGGGDVG